MRKNNNGISMISLIVIIVSVIILASMVITASFNYITQSANTEKQVLVNVISEAASILEDDINAEPSKKYIGYKVDISKILSTENNVQNIELPKEMADDVVDLFEGQWYILDGKKLSDLGIEERNQYINKYIVEDLGAVTSPTEKNGAALINYTTGAVYIVRTTKLAYVEPVLEDEAPPDISFSYNEDYKSVKKSHTITVVAEDITSRNITKYRNILCVEQKRPNKTTRI